MRQTSSPVAAATVEYLPSEHAVQAWLPAASLYVPSAHGTHCPLLPPVYPGTHVQFAAEMLPTGEAECSGHSVHVLAVALKKLPATHAQSLTASLPAGAVEYAGQVMHVLSSVAPTASEYVFTGHAEHAESAARSLYVPARHCVHEPSARSKKPALQKHFSRKNKPAFPFP
jgi:hypothetical protein